MATEVQQQVRRQRVGRAEKQRDVMQLARAGGTNQEIADALNAKYAADGRPTRLTANAVGKTIRAVMDAWADQRDRATEDVVNLEVARLDELLKGIYPRATQTWMRNRDNVDVPNPHQLKAVGAVLKIMERRARLLGLDAPEKVELTGTVSHRLVGSPQEIEQEQRLWQASGGDDGVIDATEVVELETADAVGQLTSG